MKRHIPRILLTAPASGSGKTVITAGLLSLLKKRGIEHNVLNAKQHEREAQVVLEAGRLGMVTIATNMAGRGTDIVLGGGINHQIDAILANDEMSAEE